MKFKTKVEDQAKVTVAVIPVTTGITLELEFAEMVKLRAALNRLKNYVDREAVVFNRHIVDNDYGQEGGRLRGQSEGFLKELHSLLKDTTV